MSKAPESPSSPAPTHHAHVLPPSVYGLVAALSLVWGFNWPVIKVVLAEMAPMHFRAWCLGIGALGLFALARLNGLPVRVPGGKWGRLILIAVFNMLAWNVLAVYAIGMMDSGRAAILGYTMPVWAMLLGFWLLGEPVTRRKLVGLGLGIAGMLLLIGGEIGTVGASPLGALLMIVAAVTWALGIIMIKRWPIGLPMTSFGAWQMALSLPPMWLGALLFEEGSFSPLSLSPWPLAGLIYNAALAFIFGNWAWMKIATTAPVGVSSLSTLMIPVIGVFSGMLVLGEQPHWTDYAALILVCASLATVLLPSRK